VIGDKKLSFFSRGGYQQVGVFKGIGCRPGKFAAEQDFRRMRE
jgi:hypothetical protein